MAPATTTVWGAVLGSEGSVKGAVGGTWVNVPAGLMTKAAGRTWHKSSTPTADHGERAVYGAFPKPVNRADRCPCYRMHVSRHDRGDDLMDRGAVQTREIFELANEAKFGKEYSPACEYGCGAVGAVPTACGVASRGRSAMPGPTQRRRRT